MKFSLFQKFLFFSFIIFFCNVLLGYNVYKYNKKLLESEQRVQHTEQVIYQAISVFSDGNEIKTNSRDFVVTNDQYYSALINTAAKDVFFKIKILRSLTKDNALQRQRIDSLEIYMRKRLAFALLLVDFRQKNGVASAMVYMSSQNDIYYSNPIRLITNAIEQEEKKLLTQQREIELQNLGNFNKVSMLAFVVIAAFTIILIIALWKYLLQNTEREERAAELVVANQELTYQSSEKKKRAGELRIANKELTYQSGEKGKRAEELIIANKELFYQNEEKEKRAEELIMANKELFYQNEEKEKRADELFIANEELLYQNREKEKRAAELVIANNELFFQNDEKEKRAAELVIANNELIFQNEEKEKRAAELIIANRELRYQNEEKEKRAVELFIANEELLYHNQEKEKRAAELVIANNELFFQNEEKEKRAAELVIANKELSFQNIEKEKRAVELAFANGELLFQNDVRKIVERNLLQSESRLKEAQAIAHIGNFEVDLVKDTEVWSDEMYKIYGVSKQDVTPSTKLFLSFVHPDDMERITADVNESFRSFENSTSNFKFIHVDGSIRFAYCEIRFEVDEGKKPIRLFGVLQDVTEDRLAGIERTKMVNDLTARNNDLEQFSYIISHNLRAPVANIIGAANALNDVDLDNEDKEILTKAINTSVMKLDDVVKDLNHILQVKASINETKEVVMFSVLVEDIKKSIEDIVTRKDIDIKCDFSKYDKFLTIKPYMYSIFYNLISNSVKYCRQHVLCSITIRSRVIENVLQLTFKDNGMGIDLEKKGDQVFGLYKRFHQNIEGKGMGLYMVKTQVETLGGKISIKSQENVGTEFVIEFEI